jgi:hypothetical protein
MVNISGKRELYDVNYDNDVKNRKGVYILYKTISGPPRYVGRSDTGLKTRLNDHNSEGKYKYYSFKNCSLKDAYIWECRYWHKYQNTIDNSLLKGGKHPATPTDKNWGCPICGK